MEKDELQYEDFDPRILDPEKFVNFWHSAIEVNWAPLRRLLS